MASSKYPEEGEGSRQLKLLLPRSDGAYRRIGLQDGEEDVEAPGQATTDRRSQVLEEMGHMNAGDVEWLMEQMAKTRPDLTASLMQPPPVDTTPRRVSKRMVTPPVASRRSTWAEQLGDEINDVAAGEWERQLTPQDSMGIVDTSLPVVQFSSALYFCEEGQQGGRITLEVMRIGGGGKACEVSYETKNWTAKAGVVFEQTEGVLRFEAHQYVKTIDVPLIDNEVWDVTTEFRCELGLRHVSDCNLGLYLRRCRIKFIDNDIFPSNLFANEIAEGDFGAINIFTLMREFINLMWHDPLIRFRTIKRILCDQVGNVSYLIEMLATIYLLDRVVNSKSPDDGLVLIEDRSHSLMAISLMLIGLHATEHYIDYWRQSTGGYAGPVRSKLQRSLLNKFLNYNVASRQHVKEAELVFAQAVDAGNLAENCYGGAVKMCKDFGKALAVLSIQIVAPIIFHKPFKPIAIIASLGFPVILFSFAFVRHRTTCEALDSEWDRKASLMDHITYIVDNYQLVVEFNNRDKVSIVMDELVKGCNSAHRSLGIILLNNQYVAPWMMVLVSSLYLFVGGLNVLNGEESIGIYITNLNVLKTLGAVWKDVYENVVEMQRVSPALFRFTDYMNKASNLDERMLRQSANRESTLALSSLMRTVVSSNGPDVFDMIPLSFTSRGYRFGDASDMTMAHGEVTIDQGSLTAMVGPHGGGKTTLLKILGQAMFPKSDDNTVSAMVPSHLRILHVTNTPFFVDSSLFENLTYGCHPLTDDAKHERVMRVCQLLEFTPLFLGTLQDEISQLAKKEPIKDSGWRNRLSETERHLVVVARALMANYEVMIIHRPSMSYDDHYGELVVNTLRTFVDEKGICMNPEFRELRRPRTCIFTGARLSAVKQADAVWLIAPDKIEKLQSHHTEDAGKFEKLMRQSQKAAYDHLSPRSKDLMREGLDPLQEHN